jgi:hypothetical protein
MSVISLTLKTQLLYFHDLSLDLSPFGLAYLVWLQICYAEVQLSMIDSFHTGSWGIRSGRVVFSCIPVPFICVQAWCKVVTKYSISGVESSM